MVEAVINVLHFISEFYMSLTPNALLPASRSILRVRPYEDLADVAAATFEEEESHSVQSRTVRDDPVMQQR